MPKAMVPDFSLRNWHFDPEHRICGKVYASQSAIYFDNEEVALHITHITEYPHDKVCLTRSGYKIRLMPEDEKDFKK